MMAELEKETAEYLVTFRYSERHGSPVLVVRSRAEGRYLAEHTRFNLLADDGTRLATPAIDEPAARFILEHFERRGDTESFDIFESDLRAGVLRPRAMPPISPSQVRHTLTNAEHSFTATGGKLAAHWPIFEKY